MIPPPVRGYNREEEKRIAASPPLFSEEIGGRVEFEVAGADGIRYNGGKKSPLFPAKRAYFQKRREYL